MAKYNTDRLTTQHLFSLQIGGGKTNSSVLGIWDIAKDAEMIKQSHGGPIVYFITSK